MKIKQLMLTAVVSTGLLFAITAHAKKDDAGAGHDYRIFHIVKYSLVGVTAEDLKLKPIP